MARTPQRHAAAVGLLGLLLDLEERAALPGFRLDGERWDCIDWPEWHADMWPLLAAHDHWHWTVDGEEGEEDDLPPPSGEEES